jgi:non-lysosomal glucosylceramidase
MPYRSSMDYAHKPRSGVALGGIGTGGIELRHDGVFYNWHIFNNLPFGSGAKFPFADESMLFFMLRWQLPDQRARIKLLQIDWGDTTAGIEIYRYSFPWISGIAHIDYEACFPFVRMQFSDPEMPLTVTLEAFSPFIPHDVKNSALPGVFFNFTVKSTARQPIDVMLMATLRSGIGYDVPHKQHANAIHQEDWGKIAEMQITGMDAAHASYGSQALASLNPDSTYYLGWEARHPFYETLIRQKTLPNIDTTEGRNNLNAETGQLQAREKSFSSLALSRTLQPEQGFDHTFLTSWYFPNLYSEDKSESVKAVCEGNYYANFFTSAADVARYLQEHHDSLQARTRQFTSAFYDSSLPEAILDQVNSHLNTLITSSWLTKDGKYAIQEGITSSGYWGPMATIDVSLYGGLTLLALFPTLDQAMLRAHARIQLESGEISHGIDRHFDWFELETRPNVPTRVDLPAQYAVLVLRNALWTGDEAFLREMWPSVQRALDYALRERDSDGDGIPDAGGVNTSYDNLAMYGAAAYVGSVWLSALLHALAAARRLGDEAAVSTYSALLERAREQFERKLWNGNYYRLYSAGDQQDEGCLTDQLIGQWCGHLIGLENIVAQDRIGQVIEHILAQSFDPEIGIRNCTYPGSYFHEVAEDCWWDQGNTSWSGVSLAFAGLLLYQGRTEAAEQVIRAVDQYHRRSGVYFDHPEWGGHYLRPLSAWSILNGALGLSIHAGRYRFAPALQGDRLKLFFATPHGTAHYQQDRQGGTVTLTVASGELRVTDLRFAGWAGTSAGTSTTKVDGQALTQAVYSNPF